jgi:pimeloyl-ACP methyl ester carboxylesterase
VGGSILARLTRERGFDVALVQLGATLAATSPPIRIAEEYAILFHDSEGAAAQAALALPVDDDERAVAWADLVWAMGGTGKFVWPIPDKGLRRRLHRVTAPALIVWDRTTSSSRRCTPAKFADRLADARVELVPGAGHVPQLERLDLVAPLVLEFLAGR